MPELGGLCSFVLERFLNGESSTTMGMVVPKTCYNSIHTGWDRRHTLLVCVCVCASNADSARRGAFPVGRDRLEAPQLFSLGPVCENRKAASRQGVSVTVSTAFHRLGHGDVEAGVVS